MDPSNAHAHPESPISSSCYSGNSSVPKTYGIVLDLRRLWADGFRISLSKAIGVLEFWNDAVLRDPTSMFEQIIIASVASVNYIYIYIYIIRRDLWHQSV